MHGEVLVPQTGPSGYFRKLGPPSRSRWSATVGYRISTSPVHLCTAMRVQISQSEEPSESLHDLLQQRCGQLVPVLSHCTISCPPIVRDLDCQTSRAEEYRDVDVAQRHALPVIEHDHPRQRLPRRREPNQ